MPSQRSEHHLWTRTVFLPASFNIAGYNPPASTGKLPVTVRCPSSYYLYNTETSRQTGGRRIFIAEKDTQVETLQPSRMNCGGTQISVASRRLILILDSIYWLQQGNNFLECVYNTTKAHCRAFRQGRAIHVRRSVMTRGRIEPILQRVIRNASTIYTLYPMQHSAGDGTGIAA